MTKPLSIMVVVLTLLTSTVAAEEPAVEALLRRRILDPNLPEAEVRAFTESRVPLVSKVESAAEWEQTAEQLRRDVLERVVLRGVPANWRTRGAKTEWLETIAGGPGYRIKKLRYEAVPGWWIPALLYEPENLSGKVPVSLSLNGHEEMGKSISYKQIRCINQARRGMLVLSPEWIGMGQLRGPGYEHSKMNQLDLCGASGVSPFFLAMARALDVLLAHENADLQRVAVSGFSGGGWQTLLISALDPRVTLANPVAGYSSLRTRTRFLADLGDSEQIPPDLATVVDYTHLTAMLAPRPSLLTYNAKDNCCFRAADALQPLLDAAAPIFALYGKESNLRGHINHDPGDHNFGRDNREAYYRMLGDHFFTGQPFDPQEIPCDREVKVHTDLLVDLPVNNATFNSLALALSADLPRQPKLPAGKAAAQQWQEEHRSTLCDVVRSKHAHAVAERAGVEEANGITATFWRLRMDDAWTVPVTELARGEPKGVTILVADAGRGNAAAEADRLLAAVGRVLAVDLFSFGESKPRIHSSLLALLVSAVGERPLGVQAGQLAAIARWATGRFSDGPVTIVATGPRTSTIALVAAGLDEQAIGGVELSAALGSLKEIIEQDWAVGRAPELFCFGLLEAFDIKHLAALVAPRPVTFRRASKRATVELSELSSWFAALGKEFQPLQ